MFRISRAVPALPHIPSWCVQGNFTFTCTFFFCLKVSTRFKFIQNDRPMYIFVYFSRQNFWLSWWIIWRILWMANPLITNFLSLNLIQLRYNLFMNVVRRYVLLFSCVVRYWRTMRLKWELYTSLHFRKMARPSLCSSKINSMCCNVL